MGVRNISWPKVTVDAWIPSRQPAVKGKSRKLLVLLGSVALLLLLCGELRTGWAQSKLLAAVSARLQYSVGAGPSPSPLAAPSGPYDQRLGYSRLPNMVARLSDSFAVSAQARNSSAAREFSSLGGYPVYSEKSQAGLQISGRSGQALFSARYPSEVYPAFDQIPPLVVKSLLYVENRDLLDDAPLTNPAIEWQRLAKAVVDVSLNAVYPAHPISGGSTLATQLEKVRHSASGRTSSRRGSRCPCPARLRSSARTSSSSRR